MSSDLNDGRSTLTQLLERVNALKQRSSSLVSTSSDIVSLLSSPVTSTQTTQSRKATQPELITPQTYAKSFTLPHPEPKVAFANVSSPTTKFPDDDDDDMLDCSDDLNQPHARSGDLSQLPLSDANMVFSTMVLRPSHDAPATDGETFQRLQLIESWVGNVRTSATTLGAVESLVSRIVELIYHPPQSSSSAGAPVVSRDAEDMFDMDEDVDFVCAAPGNEGPADIDDLPETPTYASSSPAAAFTPSQSSSAPATTMIDGMLVPEGVRFVNGTWVSAVVDDTVADLDDIGDFDAGWSEGSRSCSRPDSPSLADADLEDYDDVGDVDDMRVGPAPRRAAGKNQPSLNTLTKDEVARFLTQQELLGDADHDSAGGRVVTTRLGLIKGSKKHVNDLGAALSARVTGEEYPEDLDDLEGLAEEDEDASSGARASQSLSRPDEEVAEAADAVPDMPITARGKPQSRNQYPTDLDHVPDSVSDASDFAGSHAPSTTSLEQSSVLSSGGHRSRRSSINVDVSSTRWGFSRSATHTPMSSSASMSVPGTPDVRREQLSDDDLDGLSDMDDDTDAQDLKIDLDALHKTRNDGANRELREFDLQPPLITAFECADAQQHAMFDPSGMLATEQVARGDVKRGVAGDQSQQLSYVLMSQFPHLAHYDTVRATLEGHLPSEGE